MEYAFSFRNEIWEDNHFNTTCNSYTVIQFIIISIITLDTINYQHYKNTMHETHLKIKVSQLYLGSPS